MGRRLWGSSRAHQGVHSKATIRPRGHGSTDSFEGSPQEVEGRDLGEVVHDSDTKGGREPRPYLSGYFRIKGLKLNWLYKFSPWFDVMLHVKFESPMRTAIGKYDGEWHVRVMST